MIYFKDMNLKDTIGRGLGLELNFAGPVKGIFSSSEEELVGYLNYYQAHYNREIQIDSIEFFSKYKHQGYGRATINKLKNEYPGYTISGQSMPHEDIKTFWLKQGAKFMSCSSCENYEKCGGVECFGDCCDEPYDYTFTIPSNSPILKKEVSVTSKIDFNLPILVIGFEENEEIELDLDERRHMNKIANNINTHFNKDSIYIPYSDSNTIIPELNGGIFLPDWFKNDSKEFIAELSSKNIGDKIQIVGMHRELCVTQAATIIKKNIPNLEPIIIEHDNYTISAIYSAAEGDTIDQILYEHELLPRYIDNN